MTSFKGWLAYVVVADSTDPAIAAEQVAMLKSIQTIRRVALLLSPQRAAVEPEVIARLGADLVVRRYWEMPPPLDALRGAAESGESHVVVAFAEHVLSRAAVVGYLDYHVRRGQGESEFTPGIFETWRTDPVAKAWDIDRLPMPKIEAPVAAAAEPVNSGIRERASRYAHRYLPWMVPVVRAARQVFASPSGAPQAESPVQAAAPVASVAAAASASAVRPLIYLGSQRDQVDLLVDRVREFYPFPRVINLVLTNLCNLKCVMCPYHSPEYPDQSGYMGARRYMSDPIFEQVAQEAAAHGSWLKMGQLEEVFLHPKLVKFIERAHQVGVPYMHITTNGTLLNRERSTALLNSGLTQMNISVDAMKPETYRKLRGWDLNKLVKNVEEVLELREKLGSKTQVFVAMILQDDAVAEEPDFIRFWREKGADGAYVYQLSEHHHAQNYFRAKYFDHSPPEQRHACQSVWQECYVYPEGEVSTCCTTMILVPQKGLIHLGNLNEESLTDIWLGRNYTGLRKRLIVNELENDPACRDCDIWHACELRSERRDGYLVEMNPTTAVHWFRR